LEFWFVAEAAPKRSRTWLWFFIVLVVLTGFALILPLVILPRLHGLEPVTAEGLAAARARWEQHGPRDYDLEYRKRGTVSGTFTVRVRDGKPAAVLMDGQPLDRSSNPKLYDYYTIPGIFNDLERFLELAEKPGNAEPAILRARFDPVDGHITRYVYSIPSQKVEVSVQLRKQPAAQ